MTLKRVLGFVLVIFPATVALVFGCMKRPPESVDKGVEVSCSAVDVAEENMASGSVSKIKQGEFSSEISTQQIADMYAVPTNLHSMEVTSKAAGSNTFWLREKDQRILSTGEYDEPRVIDHELSIGPAATATSLVAKSYGQKKSLLASFGVKPSSSVSIFSNCNYGATFHNLKTETILVPIPDKVKDRKAPNPVCGGLADCTRPMLVTQMSVDLWFKLDEGKSEQKFTLLTQMSSEVPFFASVLKNCVQQPVQQEEHSNPVVVTQCTEVKDFTFGVDPTPTPTPTP